MTWTASTLVLIIDERTCRNCNSTSRSSSVAVKIESPAKRWWIPPEDVNLRNYLPHSEPLVVSSDTPFCEHCWKVTDPLQTSLFPSLFKPHRVWGPRLGEEPQGPKALRDEDF